MTEIGSALSSAYVPRMADKARAQEKLLGDEDKDFSSRTKGRSRLDRARIHV